MGADPKDDRLSHGAHEIIRPETLDPNRGANMSKQLKAKYLKATNEELALIARLTATPVFDRLDAGELKIVADDDWSGVPQLEERVSLQIPKDLYRKVVRASRRRRTTPDRLAARWIAEHVNAA
jgi:hypothetical protein